MPFGFHLYPGAVQELWWGQTSAGLLGMSRVLCRVLCGARVHGGACGALSPQLSEGWWEDMEPTGRARHQGRGSPWGRGAGGERGAWGLSTEVCRMGRSAGVFGGPSGAGG